MLFLNSKKNVFWKEHPCTCRSCLQFDFENFSNENFVDNGKGNSDLEEFYEEINQTEQIFNISTVPSFASLFYESSMEPFHFVKIKEKTLPKKTLLIHTNSLFQRVRYFHGLHPKAVLWRNSSVKKFSTIPIRIVMTPNENYYDTYVDFNNDLELDVYTCNMLTIFTQNLYIRYAYNIFQ